MNTNTLTFLIVVIILGSVIFYKYNFHVKHTIHVDSTTSSKAFQTKKAHIKESHDLIHKSAEVIHNKKQTQKILDSITYATKKKFLVYQIGVNRRTPQEFAAMIKKVDGKVPNIYLFKENRHSYYLIKNDGYATQEEMITNYDEVETLLQKAGISDRAVIINLNNFCHLRGKIKLANDKKTSLKKKQDCLVCD